MGSLVIQFGRFGTAELKKSRVLKDKSKGNLVLSIHPESGTLREVQIIEDTLELGASQCDAIVCVQYTRTHVVLTFDLGIVPPELRYELLDLYTEDLTRFLAQGVVEKIAEMYPEHVKAVNTAHKAATAR